MNYHQAIFHRYGESMALLFKKTGYKCTRKPSCFSGNYSPQRCKQIWIQAYLVKDKELSLIAQYIVLMTAQS